MCSGFYFCAFKCLEEDKGFQEDPEDPDYEEGQEEEFAEGKFYHSLIILILCFITTILVEPVFKY